LRNDDSTNIEAGEWLWLIAYRLDRDRMSFELAFIATAICKPLGQACRIEGDVADGGIALSFVLVSPLASFHRNSAPNTCDMAFCCEPPLTLISCKRGPLPDGPG